MKRFSVHVVAGSREIHTKRRRDKVSPAWWESFNNNDREIEGEDRWPELLCPDVPLQDIPGDICGPAVFGRGHQWHGGQLSRRHQVRDTENIIVLWFHFNIFITATCWWIWSNNNFLTQIDLRRTAEIVKINIRVANCSNSTTESKIINNYIQHSYMYLIVETIQHSFQTFYFKF